MARSAQAWLENVFIVVLLDLGEGGLGLLGVPKQEKQHKLALVMSYPSAKRMGRALSALALPYKMGGSMGASRVDLSNRWTS